MPAPSSSPPPGERLLSLWRRTRVLPFGAHLFGAVLGRSVPYSGSIRPRVLALEPGFARIAMDDRRGLRNHLHSLHAVALANLGELASGLAMTTVLPAGVRAIVTGIETEYEKKARGTIVAESRVEPPAVTAEVECVVEAALRDAGGDVVARVRARWRLRPA